jgi:hypothetical protein
MVVTNIQTFSGDVEVTSNLLVPNTGTASFSNANPSKNFQLTIGSNIFANAYADMFAESNALTVHGRVGANLFVGDGGLLSNIATTLGDIVNQGNTVANVITFTQNATYDVGIITEQNVGISISNTSPSAEYQLSVGSNIFANTYADMFASSNALTVHGRVGANLFVGDGGLLSNIATTLGDIVNQGNAVSNTIIFESGADTTSNTGIVTRANVGISVSNTEPSGEFQFGVGSNLFVNTHSSNVLTVYGNVTANTLTLGDLRVTTSYGLDHVTAQNATTGDTINLTNGVTGLTISSNAVVGGNITASNAIISSNIQLGGRLNYDANVFIDTLRVADIAANLVTYDQSTGELLDSGGLFLNKMAIISEQPSGALTGDTTVLENHGSYILTTSSLETNSNSWNAFDDNASIAWTSQNDTYIGASNIYDENGTTQLSVASSTEKGEWIAIELPYKTKLRHMKLTPSSVASYPNKANLYATNDSTTWVELKNWEGVTPSSASDVQTVLVNSTTDYKKYAIVTTKVAGDSANVSIGECRLFTESFSVEGGIVTTTAPATSGGFSGNVEVGTANLFVDTTTGNVGIGTTAPAKSLEVQGTLRMSNASTGGASDLLVSKSTTWTEQQKLTDTYGLTYDYFGASVAISGDGMYAMVGAYGTDDVASASGSVFIFTRSGSTWTQQAELVATDPSLNAFVGAGVSISSDGTYAISGAYNKTVTVTNDGAAYIFTRSGSSWSQQRIVASDAAQGEQFGKSVYISSDGTYAIVGADRGDGLAGLNQGAAYIFTRSGSSWSEQQKLIPSDAAANDYFGFAASISGDGTYAIVGAYNNTDTIDRQGAAYIFTRSGSSWTQQAKLLASDPDITDYFGWDVDISSDGTTAIVGATGNDDAGDRSGSAYIFTRSGSSWTQQQKLTASDAAAQDNFGNQVSISDDGSRAIVGAVYADITFADQGAAYIFTRSGSTWTQTSKLLALDAAASDYFSSYAVGISGDGGYAIVGAYANDDGGASSGSAYIFTQPEYLTSTTSISAAGSVLSFTGQHMCFPDGPMGQGQIVSANKNKYITLNGPLTTGAQAIKSSESLPVVSLSNVTNDRSVFGVVDHQEQSGTTRIQESGIGKVTQEKEWGDNRVIVNSLGEGALWVANTNGNLVSGDYITTSNIAGYGQKQESEFLANYTVAKITMDCDFNPEDLPVQVIKKDAEGNNVLDTYGRLQWEDTDRTQKAYRIRYLTTDGQRTDQANAVWTAAYVGCTYHCG